MMMEKRYYFVQGGKPYGPVAVSDFQRYGIDGQTLVFTKGMANWTRAADVPELSHLFAPNPSEPVPVPPAPPLSPEVPTQPNAPEGKQTKKLRIAAVICVLALLALLLVVIFFYPFPFQNKGAGEATYTDSDSVCADVVVDSCSAWDTCYAQTDVDADVAPHKLAVLEATAPCLNPQAGYTYEASHLVDGDPSTIWAIDLDEDLGDYYGPSFRIESGRLAYIIIRNGYGRSTTSFRNNTRAAEVTVCDEGVGEGGYDITTVRLQDTNDPQKIVIPASYTDNVEYVKLSFGNPADGSKFYRGAKWNDLCISEVEFWGY